MNPQIILWFLRTHDSTIYGNNNVSKFFPIVRRIQDEFKHFFCVYDLRTNPKYDAEKYSLFKMIRMFHNLQKNFELYWDPAQYLSINEQAIWFQVRHKHKLQIMFKDAVDGFQDDDVCDSGYTYYLIYLNYDIPDSKHYICATSERVICILKYLKTEWNHV